MVEIALPVASAVSFVCAAFLAYHGKEGWGWFVFAGIIVITASAQ
jgi:hypothetical protein